MTKQMGIKGKLIILCISLCILGAAIGIIGFWGVGKVTTTYDKLPAFSIPKLEAADDLLLSFRRIRIHLRTLGLPGLPKTDEAKTIEDLKKEMARYEEVDQHYKETPFIDGEAELYKPVNETWISFKKVGEDILTLNASGRPEDREKMIQIFLKDCPEHAAAYTAHIEKLREFHKSNAQKWSEEAKSTALQTKTLISLLIAFGTLVGMLAGFFFANSLSKNIRLVTEDLLGGSVQVAQASNQISASSTALSQSTSELASSLEEAVATMEEMTAMVQLNTKNAAEASSKSKETEAVATQGATEIKALVGSIEDIASDSKKIEEIISIIDDIAFQTNLLALNAAVEAARAGEQGKGFAVVADAVRSLAQRSAEAAKDISGLIKGSVEKIAKGSQQANESGEVLEKIVGAVKIVSTLNAEIANASQEQSNGISQIGQTLNQIDQMTQSNAGTSEETAAASEELAAQSDSLKSCVLTLRMIVDGGAPAELQTRENPILEMQTKQKKGKMAA
jgi:methyl-accepting chemotaxis protein